MARRTSWTNRLSEIRRSVRESVRSHYERKDIEKLFQLHPRAAQELMRAISVGARIGRSLLVERQALEEFLERVAESNDSEKAIQAFRQTETPIRSKKLRHLIQQDEIFATLDTLPSNVKLQPGLLQITFTNVADLAQSLYRLAQAIDGDIEGCKERFDPPNPIIEEDPVAADVRAAFAALEEVERERAQQRSLNSGPQ